MIARLTDERLIRLGGVALSVAVWVLGMVTPARDGLTPTYLFSFTGLLVALVTVDLTLPDEDAALPRRLAWFTAEIVLAYFVVAVHGTLIRPALIYLLPASRALLLFGPGLGIGMSFAVWLAYGLNIAGYAWPDHLGEYPNYLSFFLAPYVVTVALTLAMVRQANSRRRIETLYDQLRRVHEELQSLHRRAQETAVTEERNRLAREIHDSLAHYLTVMNLQLEAAEKLVDGRPNEALEQVKKARRLTLESLQEVRRSVAALRAPSYEAVSLPRALSALVAEFGEATGLDARGEIQLPENEAIPVEIANACYRAAQEGLTNVQRHAHATSARITLDRTGQVLRLVVSDDGVGPTPPDGRSNGGFGLQGLRERVALLGGELDFGPNEPSGSSLTVTIPLERREV